MPNKDYIIQIQGEEERSRGVVYEVDLSQNPIGEGGMGRVYKGRRIEQSTGTSIPVAVKFLYEGLPDSVLDRAKREASIKIKCENLVEMIGFVNVPQENPDGSITNHYHVISEFLQGVMLHDLLKGIITDVYGNEVEYAKELYNLYCKDRNKFAIEIVKKTLSGLIFLHDAGYVHRDIDPSNIMITSDRNIKLIDFGVAHKIEAEQNGPLLTRVGSFLGKGEYAAPEMALGDVTHQNATTDIYAMGILMYQLLTGELPFTGSLSDVLIMQQHDDVPVDKIKDKKMRSIVAKATQKKQSERYQTASEFRVALDSYEKGGGRKTPEPPSPYVQPSSGGGVRRPKAPGKDGGTTPAPPHPSTESLVAKTSYIYLGAVICGLLVGALLAWAL